MEKHETATSPDKLGELAGLTGMKWMVACHKHNLRVVTSVADRLVMLHLGRKVQDGDPHAVVNDPAVIDIYVGGGVHVER